MSDFQWVAAAIVAAMSAARITRLITWDDFPPSVWLRIKFADLVGDKWGKVVNCMWCFGPYAAAFVLGWGYLTGFDKWWWLFNGWLALAYAASMVVVRDGDDD